MTISLDEGQGRRHVNLNDLSYEEKLEYVNEHRTIFGMGYALMHGEDQKKIRKLYFEKFPDGTDVNSHPEILAKISMVRVSGYFDQIYREIINLNRKRAELTWEQQRKDENILVEFDRERKLLVQYIEDNPAQLVKVKESQKVLRIIDAVSGEIDVRYNPYRKIGLLTDCLKYVNACNASELPSDLIEGKRIIGDLRVDFAWISRGSRLRHRSAKCSLMLSPIIAFGCLVGGLAMTGPAGWALLGMVAVTAILAVALVKNRQKYDLLSAMIRYIELTDTAKNAEMNQVDSLRESIGVM